MVSPGRVCDTKVETCGNPKRSGKVRAERTCSINQKVLLAFRQRDHAVAGRRGSKTADIRAAPKRIAQGSRSRTWPRAFTLAAPASDCSGRMLENLTTPTFVGVNSNMDAELLYRKRPGVVRGSIRRNGDLAGAKTRSR